MADAEDPALTAEMEQLAASFLSMAQKIFGLPFDFSEQSLTHLDQLITDAYPNGNALDSTLLPFGAYVGETIRHNLGGVWVQTEESGSSLRDVGGQGIGTYPFTWVRKRFENGMEDSIAYKYSYVKAEVEKSRGSPVEPVAPRPYVPPAPSREATEEELQRLARVPLLVLFLVAGADGKISKKEMSAFDKAIEDITEETSPLLSNCLDWLTENFEAYLEQVNTSETDPLDDLTLAGSTLHDCFPADAGAFQHGLIDLGVKIAEASGGFLGMGSKISEQEMATLAAISLALSKAQS
jgi:hypothetical protein